MNNQVLPESLLEQAYSNNWFKLFVKKEFGGAELPLIEAIDELFKASEIDGSLGWCVNLGSGASYFSGFMTTEAVNELLSDKKNVFAGSGEIGTVTEVENSFEVSGVWTRGTGSVHATAFTVNAEFADGRIQSFVLPKDQVQIKNTWTMMGLKNSSTYQLKSDKIVIPKHHSFSIGELNPDTSYSLHHIPFIPFAKSCMIFSLLGMASRMVNEIKMDANFKLKAEKEAEKLSQEIEKYRLELKELIKDYEYAVTIKNQEEIGSEELELMVKVAAKNVLLKAHSLYFSCGLSAADETKDFNLAYRDLLVASQHFLFR